MGNQVKLRRTLIILVYLLVLPAKLSKLAKKNWRFPVCTKLGKMTQLFLHKLSCPAKTDLTISFTYLKKFPKKNNYMKFVGVLQYS